MYLQSEAPVRLKSIVLVFSLFAIAVRGYAQTDVRPPIMRARHLESAPTDEKQKFAKTNCGDYGVPKLDQTQNFGLTTILYRQGYVLENSASDKVAIWVCEGLERGQLDQPRTERKNQFAPDPDLPAGQRSELADYKGGKFDRGHMAPAGDFNDPTLKLQSFYLSNMAPQRWGPQSEILAASGR
jgi:DNA/RNA endonuclease G (NUC1)